MLANLETFLMLQTSKVAWPSWMVSYGLQPHMVSHPGKSNNRIDHSFHPNWLDRGNPPLHKGKTMTVESDGMNEMTMNQMISTLVWT